MGSLNPLLFGFFLQPYLLPGCVQSLKIMAGQEIQLIAQALIMVGEETNSLVILTLFQVILQDSNGPNISQEKIGMHFQNPAVRVYSYNVLKPS